MAKGDDEAERLVELLRRVVAAHDPQLDSLRFGVRGPLDGRLDQTPAKPMTT